MFLKWNWPGILWAFFIFFLCSLPGNDVPKVQFLFDDFDKVAHFGLFFILSALMYRGFTKQNSFSVLSQFPYFIITLFCILYGGGIELYQGYFVIDRSADKYDLVADIMGCIMSLTFLKKGWLNLLTGRNKIKN
jgi:VanZ family protein